ncbi:MAG TPA: hypothetical protein PKE17_19870 [Saprospiraceae bacterium]|nr:hypothetical protein [Saprospiraceae bacterium]
MQTELKRLSILQTGKMLAVMYSFITVITLPIILIGGASKGTSSAIPMVVVLLYPVFGFVGGIVLAVLYNLAAKWIGGLRFTIEPSE